MFKINVKLANILNHNLNNLFKGANMDFLMDYQSNILKYVQSAAFDKRKLLLLYMATGTGKTLTSLSCASALLAQGKAKRIVILSPKSIQEEFMKQFTKFCTIIDPTNENAEKQQLLSLLRSKIISICYNSGRTYSYFKALKQFDDTIYIIDEAHLFLRAIMKHQIPDNQMEAIARIHSSSADNDFSNTGQCQKIYNIFKTLRRSYFLFLTGTPSAKTPFETVSMFNLAGAEFPTTIDDFMLTYFNGVEPQHVRELKTQLKGIVAYVAGNDTLQKLKASPLEVVEVEMTDYQYNQYLEDYQQELQEKGYVRHVNKYGWGFGQISSFHAKTFGDSVYVEPKNHKGETDVSAQVVDETHAPKIIKMFRDSEKVYGKCCFYFRFVEKGVNTMRRHLENNGYTLASLNMDEVFSVPGKRYIVFTGAESIKTKYTYTKFFNSEKNVYGEYIKYIILSPAGSVGLNLGAVRYLGIGAVEYNFSAIRQIMGRCNRLNSHLSLPVADRTLVNKIYLATKNKKYCKEHVKEMRTWYTRRAPDHEEEFPSIERCIYQDSLMDDKVNESFRQILQEVSIV